MEKNLLVAMSCTKKLEFCAAHRLMGHPGGCGFIHGHNYVVEVTAIQCEDYLNSLGVVADFGTLKSKLQAWLDKNWDHGLILNSDDVDAVTNIGYVPTTDGRTQKLFTFSSINPTAEYMANYLLNNVCVGLFKDEKFAIVKVEVWETPSSKASAYIAECIDDDNEPETI